MQNEFELELELDDHEIGALALLTGQPGWAVYHKIRRFNVGKFHTAMINVTSGSNDAIVEAHRVVKVAAQLYQSDTDVVNAIVQGYTQSKRPQGPPTDITEGLIDLGPAASTLDDLHLSEEVEY